MKNFAAFPTVSTTVASAVTGVRREDFNQAVFHGYEPRHRPESGKARQFDGFELFGLVAFGYLRAEGFDLPNAAIKSNEARRILEKIPDAKKIHIGGGAYWTDSFPIDEAPLAQITIHVDRIRKDLAEKLANYTGEQ